MTVQAVCVPERRSVRHDPVLAKFVTVLYHLIVKHVKLHDMIVAILGQNQYEIVEPVPVS
jgi:hypothetical protein